jgi:hypothetical protein
MLSGGTIISDMIPADTSLLPRVLRRARGYAAAAPQTHTSMVEHRVTMALLPTAERIPPCVMAVVKLSQAMSCRRGTNVDDISVDGLLAAHKASQNGSNCTRIMMPRKM